MSATDGSRPQLRSVADGKLYDLSGEMTIGRLDDCNIVLDQETGISRKHARIAVVDHDVFVTDLGSLNGTLLNGRVIESKARLSHGDILVFYVNEYEVLIPSQESETQIDPNKTIFIDRNSRIEQAEAPDRTQTQLSLEERARSQEQARADEQARAEEQARAAEPVSYTHLTLPTILRV